MVNRTGILNSAGNLALHLAGNLQFYGHVSGNTGYVRDRDKEFSDKNVPQQTVIELLRHTHNVIQKHCPDSAMTKWTILIPYW